MNKVINPEQMVQVTQQFTQEHMKLGLTDELSTTSDGDLFNLIIDRCCVFFLFSW